MAVYGAVYDPPRAGLPAVVVVFQDGEVLQARAAASVAAGEAFLETVMKEFAEQVGGDVRAR